MQLSNCYTKNVLLNFPRLLFRGQIHNDALRNLIYIYELWGYWLASYYMCMLTLLQKCIFMHILNGDEMNLDEK